MSLKIDPVNLERSFKMTKIINVSSPIQSSRNFPDTQLSSPKSGLYSATVFGEYFDSEGDSDSSPSSLNRTGKREFTAESLERHSKEPNLNLKGEHHSSFEKKKSVLIKNEGSFDSKNIIRIGVVSLAVASFVSVLRYGIGFFLDKIPGILKNNI